MHGDIVRPGAGGRCDTRGLDFQARQCPPKFSRTPLGFTGTLAAGTATPIEQEPQRTFLPTRLVVPSRFDGADVAVRDIKVANQSQLTASGDIPIEAFSEVAIDACIWLDTVQAAIKIQLEMVNKTAAPIAFEAMMYGYSEG